MGPLINCNVYTPIIINIIIIKKGRQCKAERESDNHPISQKTSAPPYQPIDRKRRKWKIVEDYSRDREAWANKTTLALLCEQGHVLELTICEQPQCHSRAARQLFTNMWRTWIFSALKSSRLLFTTKLLYSVHEQNKCPSRAAPPLLTTDSCLYTKSGSTQSVQRLHTNK